MTTFVRAQHDQLRTLLRQPKSPARDTQLRGPVEKNYRKNLATTLDYDVT